MFHSVLMYHSTSWADGIMCCIFVKKLGVTSGCVAISHKSDPLVLYLPSHTMSDGVRHTAIYLWKV